MNNRAILLLVLLILLLVSGCRRAGLAGPTPIPSATPTPRSTPLPPVSTPVPPGAEANPVRMVLRPASSLATARTAAVAVAAVLSEQSGLTLDIVLADRPAEGVGALCESVDNAVTVAWLDGVSYAAAVERGCGQPALLVERDGETGETVLLVARGGLGAAAVSGLSNRAFCRISYDDLYTWIVPSLALRAQDIDPLADFRSITDYGDSIELLEALAGGDCDGAGVAQSAFDEMDAEIQDALTVLDETIRLPYAVLLYPVNAPLGLRTALDDALIAMARGGEAADELEVLLGHDGLEPVEADDLEAVVNFVRASGLDFAAIDD